MKELIKAFDDLPLIVKVILCIPCLDIVWCLLFKHLIFCD